ncbi:hypothetical protein F5I97DRAFT_1925146 [Phlebopus sp. FC_14]|nr:hypothetical protein F5I97DRAFT_1925146 [Phlebopus sp. FC_14]
MSIEKVEEIWTSQSVTTSFHFPLQSPFPRGSKRPSPSVYFPPCGTGWKLVLAHPKLKTYRILFVPCTSRPAWEGAVVNVQLDVIPPDTTSPHISANAQPTLRKMAPMLGKVELWSGASLDELKDASFILKVNVVNCTASNNLFNLHFVFGPCLENSQLPPLSSRSDTLRGPAILRILDNSLRTGTSYDIKFLFKPRRLNSGRVLESPPIYAHSAVLLEACPALSKLFPVDLNYVTDYEFPLTHSENYDHDHDSDSDYEEFFQEDACQLVTADDSESHVAADSATLAAVTDEESVGTEFEEILPAADAQSTSSHSPSTHSSEESVIQHEGIDKFIQVKCAAYRTWRAFVYYCYTGQVAFSPIRSQNVGNQFPQQADGCPPLCSPKSMYRLADMLCIEHLKKEAFEALKTKLSPSNIVEETFSFFTSRHPEIHNMEFALLVTYRTDPVVQQALKVKIGQLAPGHPGAALNGLMQLLF